MYMYYRFLRYGEPCLKSSAMSQFSSYHVSIVLSNLDISFIMSLTVDPNVEFVFVFVYCLMFSSKIFHSNRDV